MLVSRGYVPGTPLGSSSSSDMAPDCAGDTPHDAEPWSAATSASTSAAVSVSSGSLVEPVPIVMRSGRAGLGATMAQSAPNVWPSAGGRGGGGERDTGAESLSFTRDPLRPRCRYNTAHVVADLKALQSHERRCPDRAQEVRRVVEFEEEMEEEGGGEGEAEGWEGDIMSELSTDEEDRLAEAVGARLGLGSMA